MKSHTMFDPYKLGSPKEYKIREHGKWMCHNFLQKKILQERFCKW